MIRYSVPYNFKFNDSYRELRKLQQQLFYLHRVTKYKITHDIDKKRRKYLLVMSAAWL